jgi:pimeloyl-ACP methyl ester carboxylesterase
MRRLFRVVLLVVLVYAGVCVLARFVYPKLLYPAPQEGALDVPPGATLLTLTAKDGTLVHALELPAPAGARTVVCFHGNGETIADGVDRAEALHRRGLGVVLVEYRGYGVSSAGSPSEEGLYADAATVLDALEARGLGPDRIALWGTSLGTGVASEMVTRGRAASLVLVAPYTSIRAIAARVAPFLPTSLILRERFDTLGKAARIRVPTLVIHGDRDEVVPYGMGRAVANAIAGATLVTVPGGMHNDLFVRDGERLLDLIGAHAAR